MEVSTGAPGDISAFTKFHFYQPVYYYEKGDDHAFPDSKELMGYQLGPSPTTGDIFCSHVLTTKDTIIKRSVLRPAYDQPLHINWRQADGEAKLTNDPLLFGADAEPTDADAASTGSIEFNPQEMIGYEFVHDIKGNKYRAKVTDYFEHQKKFMVSLGDGAKEDIVSYSELIDAVNKRLGDDDDTDPSEVLWFLESITDHKKSSDGKTYHVKVTVSGALVRKHGNHSALQLKMIL